MFLGGWLLQIAGHRFFEHNLPSTGWITYQLECPDDLDAIRRA
jgi:hypothetical protein